MSKTSENEKVALLGSAANFIVNQYTTCLLAVTQLIKIQWLMAKPANKTEFSQ